MSDLHPILQDAAEGTLPRWARVDKKRYAHMERVAELMGEWARAAGKSEVQQARWRAAGFLHDALKNAPNKELRIIVPERFARLPGPVLHGPAAGIRLRVEGVKDKGLLKAVTFHTLGHPSLGRIGKALYAADFLEPGRNLRNKWRASLRLRMPQELDDVVREILRARIQHLLKKGRPVRRETFAFWNRLSGGPSWARASEV
ncbi:MAG: HD domain-containing protein [Gemmatimonadota bacterium]|jgi:HD superfamily phosphohydrolase YqeK